MSSKPDISRKILEILSGKKAVSASEIKTTVGSKRSTKGSQKPEYAVTRAITDLVDNGYIECLDGGQGQFLRLTRDGKKKASSQKLDGYNTLVSPTWDGKWRIILLDLPERRKAERESLRYLLKKAGFVCLKNSAWISPYPFEYMFENIKKDLGLTTELMIIVSEKIDTETEKELTSLFK
jgi:DNA-binding transcriptional regulator PaaX